MPNGTAFIAGRAIAGAGDAGVSSVAYTIAGFSLAVDNGPIFLRRNRLLGRSTDRWCLYIKCHSASVVKLPIGEANVTPTFADYRQFLQGPSTSDGFYERCQLLLHVGICSILNGFEGTNIGPNPLNSVAFMP